MNLAEHLIAATRAGGELVAIDFEGTQVTWSALARGIGTLHELLSAASIGTRERVGLLGRNRLEQLGGFVSILGSGRGLVLVNAIRPAALIIEEVRELRLACLMGSRDDLVPAVVAAATNVGTMVVAIDIDQGELRFVELNRPGAGPFRPRSAGTLIEIQTSGTTGVPKRVPVLERTIQKSLQDGVRNAKGAVAQNELAPKSSPTLMFTPLVHTSGTFNTLMSLFEVRPIVLFEKFDAERYRQALLRYRPKFAPLPPTAIKMLLDSTATREDFASVIAVRAGTAPLPVELQIAFEQKFGVPVLTTYGATEFMGVATSWTLDDHRNFAQQKRGSVGRAAAGVQLRIVDPATFEELPANTQGILEAKLDRIDGGHQWIRTTDLARLDEDGFLFIVGRADDAIIRGGFKIMAGKVADVLRHFPGVYDVIVLGRPDERLGEVPVAVIEPYDDAPRPDPEAVRAFAREKLTPYEVPARIHVVDRLPRTVSDKISQPEVKRLLSELGD